jgi:hypothetical protein
VPWGGTERVIPAELRARPEVVEGELIAAAERDLSDPERRQLADKLADAAMGHLRRAQELAVLARRLRALER